jgi:hypothetical protein
VAKTFEPQRLDRVPPSNGGGTWLLLLASLILGFAVALTFRGTAFERRVALAALSILLIAKAFVVRPEWQVHWVRSTVMEISLVPQITGNFVHISAGAWFGITLLLLLCPIQVPENRIRRLYIYSLPLLTFVILSTVR